jgi:hypothetical protein
MAASWLDEYLPADVPSGEIDPREIERARALAMIRAGLGIASREPMGAAFGGGLKTYLGAQQQARQGMLAQLQAYKTRQEIGAKAKTAKQEQELQSDYDRIFGSAPITDPGGPTPANATTAMIEQLEAAGVRAYRAGKHAEAKAMFDSARDLKEKYGLTPQYFIGPNGELQMAQLSERGNTKILPQRPAEKQHWLDTGRATQGRGEYTGNLGVTVPKTPTFGESNAAARLNFDIAQTKRPQISMETGQVFYPPTATEPAGRAAPVPGFTPKKVNAPEAYTKQMSGILNTNTAIDNYLEKLKSFSAIDWANTTKRADIGTAYNNTMLQLKEAYNLGVLNGPDYSILTTVITDPLSWIKGPITSNEAIADQAKQIRTILRRNAFNLAKVHKQPESDIEAWLPPESAAPDAEAARVRAIIDASRKR